MYMYCTCMSDIEYIMTGGLPFAFWDFFVRFQGSFSRRMVLRTIQSRRAILHVQHTKRVHARSVENSGIVDLWRYVLRRA